MKLSLVLALFAVSSYAQAAVLKCTVKYKTPQMAAMEIQTSTTAALSETQAALAFYTKDAHQEVEVLATLVPAHSVWGNDKDKVSMVISDADHVSGALNWNYPLFLEIGNAPFNKENMAILTDRQGDGLAVECEADEK